MQCEVISEKIQKESKIYEDIKFANRDKTLKLKD